MELQIEIVVQQENKIKRRAQRYVFERLIEDTCNVNVSCS